MWGLYILMALLSASIVIKLAYPLRQTLPALRPRDQRLALGVVVVLPLLALVAYHGLGRPELHSSMAVFDSYQDIDARRTAALAMQPMARLLTENAEDIGALISMGQINYRLTKYDAAVPYFEKALLLAGRDGDWRERIIANVLTETLMRQSGGVVNEEVRRTVAHILRLHPKSPIGLHYHAMDLAQQNQHAEAIAIWRQLLSDGQPRDYWKQDVRTELIKSQRALAASAN